MNAIKSGTYKSVSSTTQTNLGNKLDTLSLWRPQAVTLMSFWALWVLFALFLEWWAWKLPIPNALDSNLFSKFFVSNYEKLTGIGLNCQVSESFWNEFRFGTLSCFLTSSRWNLSKYWLRYELWSWLLWTYFSCIVSTSPFRISVHCWW